MQRLLRCFAYPTGRGLCLILLIAFLIWGPIIDGADIIATVLAALLSLILFLSFFITLLNGFHLKKHLSTELLAKNEKDLSYATDSRIYAQAPAKLLLKLNTLKICPFFQLLLTVHFKNAPKCYFKQLLTHTAQARHYFANRFTFPHRGCWTNDLIEARFGDQLGLFSFYWQAKNQNTGQSIYVAPRPSSAENIPILSSSHRAGDLLSEQNRREGEPFDLKPYHPSDGINKILWKTYAKSGELISRHPEPSVHPEGQLLVFVVAGKSDDHTCSQAIAYVKRVKELGINVTLSCAGGAGYEPAHNTHDAEHLMVESVWQSDYAIQQQLMADINALIEKQQNQSDQGRIDKLVLFVSAKELHAESYKKRLLNLCTYLEQASIAPVLVLCERAAQSLKPQAKGEKKLISTFIAPRKEKSDISYQKLHYDDFMGETLRHGWEVF